MQSMYSLVGRVPDELQVYLCRKGPPVNARASWGGQSEKGDPEVWLQGFPAVDDENKQVGKLSWDALS